MEKYCVFCMTQIEDVDKPCPVCGEISSVSVPAHHLMPGTMLNNKFYVGTALGEGGFGITYIGRDTKLDMKVAIKEFYPNGYVNRSNTISPRVNDSVSEDRKEFFEKGRERFLKEARILAKFSGEPGVVDVRDFFEENNTAYIIMEYLDGVDLKDYLRQKGTLTPDQTIRLLMPVMMSLKKVHAQGLIHRDISPDNIMLVDNKVKLLDFGAARNVSAAANKSLSVMLKPGYAPEEQYRSKGNQGPWTDVYALCATMYKCITGVTPDDATQRVFSDEVKAPSALGIEISKEIETAIMRGMSVQQKDRYQSIDDLLRGLQGIVVETTGSDQTIAAVPKVKEDMVKTRYMPSEEDSATVFVEKENEVRPVVNTEREGAQEDKKEVIRETVSEKPLNQAVEEKNTQQEKKKGTDKLAIGIIAGMAVVIVGLILILVLPKGTSDSGNQGGTENKVTQVAEKEETKKTATPKVEEEVGNQESEKVPEVVSDNLYDYMFELDGDIYTLPCSYQEFVDNGWTIYSDGYSSDTLIRGNSYETFSMAKDGQRITVYSYNFSGNAKKIADCKVGGIQCEQYRCSDFKIAKGVTVGATATEIRNTLGVPNEVDEYEDMQSFSYYQQKSSDNYVKFYCYTDSKYSQITLRNFVETEDDYTVTNTERPDYLTAYAEPSELGTDPCSAIISMEGDLYQLPAPVSSFLDNGWEIVAKDGDMVAGGSGYIDVKKDGKRTTLYIANYAEYQTTVENCIVYKVAVTEKDGINVTLPSAEKIVTIGTSKADLDVAIGTEYEYTEGTYNDSYSYNEYKERAIDVLLQVEKETGIVSRISVSAQVWWY